MKAQIKLEATLLFNREHGFVYVHLSKTGGTSVRKALETKPGTESFVTRDKKHMSAREIRAYLGADVYHSMTSFAHVRNPWDLQVSNYHYVSQTPSHYLHGAIKKLGTFENFIAWRCRHVPYQQADLLCDEAGELIVDHVHKFENLEDSFEFITRKFEIDAALPKLNVSKHKDYRTYYTEQTRSLVESAFQKDIVLFDYHWDNAL